MKLSTYLFAGTVLFYCLGALLSLILRHKQKLALILGNLFAGGASLLGCWLGIRALLNSDAWDSSWGGLVPGFSYHFRLDPLAGFFMLLVCATGFVVTVYSISYEKEYLGRKSVGFLGSMYNLFLLSMVLVVSAANAFLFVVVWELMAIVSYLLVTFEHEEQSVRSAGFIYVVMTHLGTLFILLALFILYRASGSFEYSAFRGLALTSGQKNLVFLLALIGFGTKAGIVPLHIWLPRAHPAAPSNVSALMSGVMVKTAVYMLLRLVLDFTGVGPAWWGWLVAGVGLVSAFMGIIYAMVDNDLKRLLAYSTVENVGIIFIALGTGLIAWSHGLEGIAVLALSAALMHCLNHAVFKSLLFMGAGAVLHATHTKNIERLGGLIKSMPYTAAIFLCGAVAISALPPFNGFISEWLIFQSLLSLGSFAVGWLKVAGPVTAALLGLIGALAAATFIKAFGVTFLALPRSAEAEHAKEVGKPMLLAGGIMALGALILGVVPGPVLTVFERIFVSSGLNQGSFKLNPWSFNWSLVPVNLVLGESSPVTIFVLLLVLLPGVLFLSRYLGGKTKTYVDETWNCGFALNPRMEYTGTGFVKPLRRVFGIFIRQDRDIKTDYRGARYFISRIVYHNDVKSNFEEYLYRPFNKVLLQVSNRVRNFQIGSIHLYLAYIFVTLLVLLVVAR